MERQGSSSLLELVVPISSNLSYESPPFFPKGGEPGARGIGGGQAQGTSSLLSSSTDTQPVQYKLKSLEGLTQEDLVRIVAQSKLRVDSPVFVPPKQTQPRTDLPVDPPTCQEPKTEPPVHPPACPPLPPKDNHASVSACPMHASATAHASTQLPPISNSIGSPSKTAAPANKTAAPPCKTAATPVNIANPNGAKQQTVAAEKNGDSNAQHNSDAKQSEKAGGGGDAATQRVGDVDTQRSGDATESSGDVKHDGDVERIGDAGQSDDEEPKGVAKTQRGGDAVQGGKVSDMAPKMDAHSNSGIEQAESGSAAARVPSSVAEGLQQRGSCGALEALSTQWGQNVRKTISCGGVVHSTAALGASSRHGSDNGSARSGGGGDSSSAQTKPGWVREPPGCKIMSSFTDADYVSLSQILSNSEFKLVPLKDFVPLEKLIKMRLEDGIDPTRKEDYLNEEEFKMVFGCDRSDFAKMATWKKLKNKKEHGLF